MKTLRPLAPIILALTLWGCPFVTLPPDARVGLAVAAASAPLAHCPANDREVAALLNARLALDFHYQHGDHPMTQAELDTIEQARRNVNAACRLRALVDEAVGVFAPAQ